MCGRGPAIADVPVGWPLGAVTWLLGAGGGGLALRWPLSSFAGPVSLVELLPNLCSVPVSWALLLLPAAPRIPFYVDSLEWVLFSAAQP